MVEREEEGAKEETLERKAEGRPTPRLLGISPWLGPGSLQSISVIGPSSGTHTHTHKHARKHTHTHTHTHTHEREVSREWEGARQRNDARATQEEPAWLTTRELGLSESETQLTAKCGNERRQGGTVRWRRKEKGEKNQAALGGD